MLSSLIIHHIPKTAGTTLLSLVKRLTPDAVLIYKGELALMNPDIEFIRGFRSGPHPTVVMGHFYFGAHRLLGLQARYATVLRHPIERIVSHYGHEKRDPGSRLGPEIRNGMSLREYVSSGLTEVTNNYMCRLIAGVPQDAGMLLQDEWLLHAALHNLHRHYVVAGTIADLPSAFAGIAHLLEWPSYEIPCENVAPEAHSQIDEPTMEILVQRNELDLRLYDHVLRERIGWQ